MNTHITYNQMALLLVTLASMSFLNPAQAGNEKHYGKNAPFAIGDLPQGRFRGELEKLTPDQKQNALLKLHKVSFTELDLPYLHVDKQGDAFFADTTLPPKLSVKGAVAAAAAIAPASSQAISSADAFTLHSKPGVSNQIYLNFKGDTITNTAWNASSGVTSYSAVGFDTTNDPTIFSATELSQIAEIWHRVAEDYAPFNVDVTTELPVTFGPTTGKVLITKDVDANGVKMPAFGAGGVAYLNVWGASNYTSYYQPAFIFYNNLGPGYAPYIAEASAHEMGHNLSLSHESYNDGTTANAYDPGLGVGFVSWAPIMGASYNMSVTEWSKGEYPFATQFEDETSLISARLGYRTDDFGNDITTAAPLVVTATGSILATNPETDPHNLIPANKGIIGLTTDVDVFSFDAGAGAVNIAITPAWTAYYNSTSRGANLDVAATLYDSKGVQLAFNDPINETNAVISATVPAGHYFLKIAGVGNSVTPYSNYDSLGQYFITGTVAPGVDATPPTPNPMTWLKTPNAGTSTNSISMQASVATDNSGSAVQYDFTCVIGGTGCVDSGWLTTNSYTATGLQAGTSYSYQVKARDAAGNQTSPSVTASAKTAVPPDTTPPTPNPMTWASVPSAGTSTKSISMTASTATDPSGPVQYNFACTKGGAACVNATWQAASKFTATGLQACTSYSYQVQAKDAVGNTTGFSAVGSATTAAIVPVAPTSLTGSKTTTTVSLNWGATPCATKYQVWRCPVTVVKGVTSCTYPKTALTTTTTNTYSGSAPTGSYRYKVQATGSLGTSAYSKEITL